MASIKKWVVRRMSSSGSTGSLGRMASQLRRNKDPNSSSSTEESEADQQRRTTRETRRASRATLRRVRQTEKRRQSFVFEGGKTSAIQTVWDDNDNKDGSPNSSAEMTEPTVRHESMDSMESRNQEPAQEEIALPPLCPPVKELRWHSSVEEQLEEKRVRLLEKPSKVPQFRMTKKQIVLEFSPVQTQDQEEPSVPGAPPITAAIPPSFQMTRDDSMRTLNEGEDKHLIGEPDEDEDQDDTSRTSDDSEEDESDVDSLCSSSSSEPDDQDSDIDDSDIYLTDEDLTEEGQREREQLLLHQDSELSLTLASFHTQASF